jgi:hypothetical protein
VEVIGLCGRVSGASCDVVGGVIAVTLIDGPLRPGALVVGTWLDVGRDTEIVTPVGPIVLFRLDATVVGDGVLGDSELLVTSLSVVVVVARVEGGL